MNILNKKWLDKKKLCLNLAKISISLIVLWFLIHTAQLNLSLMSGVFHQPALLFTVIMLFIGMVLIGAWRWYLLNAPQGIHLGLLNTTLVTYLGAAFNILLPGSVGGDFIRIYYVVKKVPDKKSNAVLSVFFDRFTGLLGIFLTIGLMALICFDQFRNESQLFYLLLMCALCCVGALGFFVIFIVMPQRFQIGDWLLERFGMRSWLQPFVALFRAVRVYRIEKMIIAKSLILSVIIQLSIAYSIHLIAQMLGLPSIAFTYYVIAIGLTQMVNMIPITPGGIGVGEMAFAKILTLLNPGLSVPYATIFLTFRLLTFFAYVPGIFCYIPSFMNTRERTVLKEELH